MRLRTLLIVSLLTGCASQEPLVQPEPTVVYKTVYPDCGTPPQRDPIELRAIEWLVVNGRFTLSAEGYEDLSYNITEIWKGIEQLNTEIKYYEQCVAIEGPSN
jgi:hypothetical protein